MGSFPTGIKMGRDGTTEMQNVNDFGQEWQVGRGGGGSDDDTDSDPRLFHNFEGPQFPSHCELPSTSALRRRLAQSEISREQAEIACSSVDNKENFDLCVFDVMATSDEGAVEAY